MKRLLTFILLLSVISFLSCSRRLNVAKVFADAEKQTNVMLKEIPVANAGKPELVAPRTIENDQLKMVASRDWTSGFFPGSLWFLHEYNGNPQWKTEAQAFTAKIEREKTNAGTHDMGFKIYSSFGAGYRLTKDPKYREVIIEAARTLSTHFNRNVGCIRSWDHHREVWQFPVIIDNMMNLELLFEATKMTGDSSFHNIAVSHANTTLKNHYRPDNSSYHVIDYDSVSGKVLQRHTHQGYSHESAWSRGQAWGLYGFTMCYRETKNPVYLEQAKKVAAFILNHPNLPKDLVPYWDYNAPEIPSEERDASAAAITASALYELSTYVEDGKGYKSTADKILLNLTRKYRSRIGEHKGFILLHSTGSKPGKFEIDAPINYADYYYLEAVLRGDKLKKNMPLF